MNLKYKGLPDYLNPPNNYQKYKDTITSQHCPVHSKHQGERGHHKQESNFTFDQSRQHLQSKQWTYLEESRQREEKIMIQELVDENRMLRECLDQSDQIIEGLQQELLHYKNRELERRGRQVSESVLNQFRQEILMVMDQNRIINQELNCLKQSIAAKGFTSKQQINYEPTRQMNKCRSNSLDGRRMSRQNIEEQKEVENKKNQFIMSIKGMYCKIMGYRVSSLKELWRWLKGIGYLYSNLRRWHSQTSQIIQCSSLPASQLLQLLEQILTLISP